jgi:glycosyltransferase involved in cell wall biosynthesis
MPRTKLLVVTRHSPLPENDGAGAYLFDMLSFLAEQGAEIEVVWVKAEGSFVRRGWWKVPRRFSRVAHLSVVGSLAVGPFRFFWWGPLKARVLGAVKSFMTAVGLAQSLPQQNVNRQLAHLGAAGNGSSAEPSWCELPSRNEARFFFERVQAAKPDVVLSNYCWMTPLLSGLRDVRKLVLTHDVASHRLNLGGRAAPAARADHDPATAEGEQKLLSYADAILAISDADAQVFTQMLPDKDVLVAPKAARLCADAAATVPNRCLFVGGVNQPNLQGILWFLKEVWPGVREARPDAVLHICGGICESLRDGVPEGVVLRGRVEKLDAEYAQAAVVVVPLLQGTGVKIKLVEAASFGKAIVTTPIGLQGLDFLRKAVMETETAPDFATSVIRALDDGNLRVELEQRIRKSVSLQLSPQRCYGPVWNAMRGVASSTKQGTSRPSVPPFVASA